MKPAACLLLALFAASPLHAHFEVTPFPKVVQPGVPLSGLTSSDPGAMAIYKVIVPPAASRLTVLTSGGIGNVQLFVRRGVQPGEGGAGSDFESVYPGTVQRIGVPTPEAGVWYVALKADGRYAGVRLQVITPLQKGALTQPVFSPQPGIYPGPVTCQIQSRVKGGAVRFTDDGNPPGPSSPLAQGGIVLTADSTLLARAFSAAGVEGPLAEASYRIRPPDDIIDLDGVRVISHLASAKGGRHLFRIRVPAGQRLSVQTEGGKGKSQLAVLAGAIPPAGKPVKGEPTLRHPGRIEIPSTVAGDYYIALDATTAFAGRSLLAYVAGDGADLMPWAASLAPYLSVEEFDPASCEVEEGLIGAGTRRLLRYNTEVRNLGARDMVMPPPEGNPFFEFHDCHGHYHFKGFASSRLLDLAGNELRAGNKVSFCLLDGIRWRSDAAADGRYDCENQGIQAGWADVYDSGLPGQWIEIGDLPPGDYQLELTVNPDGILAETNYDNNVVTIPVTVPAE
jgi:hypothetical protein